MTLLTNCLFLGYSYIYLINRLFLGCIYLANRSFQGNIYLANRLFLGNIYLANRLFLGYIYLINRLFLGYIYLPAFAIKASFFCYSLDNIVLWKGEFR
jgi:hypothetical protein